METNVVGFHLSRPFTEYLFSLVQISNQISFVSTIGLDSFSSVGCQTFIFVSVKKIVHIFLLIFSLI